MSEVTITVCTTCRRVAGGEPVGDDAPRPGARMLERLAAEAPEGVTLRGVECLSACSRGCTLVLSGGDARWRYIYGNLDPDIHAKDILDGAARYAATPDGLVPWRERPEVFRKNTIARIPPQE